MRPRHRLTVLPAVPEPLAPLRVLAHNLRWGWHPPTQELFRSIDPDGWESSGHNPLRMLNETDARVLEQAAADPGFLHRQREVFDDLQRYLDEARWYQGLADAPRCIAYFSPEFGVSEVLPQYSGGLGVLAGDHLKAASDLGVPVVGVGLFYRAGRPAAADHGQPARGDAARAGVGRRGRPRAAVPARLRRRGERPGRAGGHRPALRRRRRAPAPPGDPARHRRGGGGGPAPAPSPRGSH